MTPSGTGNAWTTYGRLVRYVRPYAWRLVAALAFGLVFGLAQAGLVWAVRGGFLKAFDPGGTTLARVALVAALFPALAVIRGLSDFASRYYARWVGSRVVMDVRNESFAHILDLPVGFFSGSRTGDLISRIVNDTALIERAVSTVIADLVQQPFSLVAMVAWLFYLDARLSVISIVLVPLCLVPIRLFGGRLRRFTREQQERIADLTAILQEAITGIRIVKAFGMEKYERTRFAVQNRVFFSRTMRATKARSAVEPIIVLIACLAVALALVYARWAGMPWPDFLAFGMALFMMYEPIKKLSGIHLQIQESSAGADRMFELLDAEITVRNRPGAGAFSGEVRSLAFDQVSFAYEGEPVLNGVAFSVKAGTRVALVGGSGVGKTTLVNLIPRFADVTAGAILLNGTEIRDFTLASLRRAIGVVTQETVLFNDTVANNIAYGSSDATVEAIRQAAERAHAAEFIERMPLRYDTVIGEFGVRLSGGQRQRLAIARAILRNPPILILDEATSALDAQSERIVQSALEDLMQGRTVFVIAHRLSTVIHCDRVLVLAGGRIVEDGTHGELLARGGEYAKLYRLQFSDGPDTA
jgi:subfamily B ATP-binding cassette protein MsbA